MKLFQRNAEVRGQMLMQLQINMHCPITYDMAVKYTW